MVFDVITVAADLVGIAKELELQVESEGVTKSL